jgi:hypothetical protein
MVVMVLQQTTILMLWQQATNSFNVANIVATSNNSLNATLISSSSLNGITTNVIATSNCSLNVVMCVSYVDKLSPI